MRSRLALAAFLALAAVTAPARARPAAPPGRSDVIGGDAWPVRDSYRIHVAPREASEPTLEIELDLVYASIGERSLPDWIDVGTREPSAIRAWSDGGRALGTRLTGDARAGYRIELTLPSPSEVGARVDHVRFEQAAPTPRRFGWRRALAEIEWAAPSRVDAAHVSSVVVVPSGASLPGQACGPEGARLVCAGTLRGLGGAPIIVRAPADLLGLGLLVLTLSASVLGFVRCLRGRARELADDLRAIPVLPSETPGGAYRAPPVRAVSATLDLTRATRALSFRAALIAASGLASVGVVAWLASGSSPWPMPSLVAACVALAGCATSALVARG